MLKAHLAVIDGVKPGMVCCDVDKIARDIIEKDYPGTLAMGWAMGWALKSTSGPGSAAGIRRCARLEWWLPMSPASISRPNTACALRICSSSQRMAAAA